MLTKQFRKLRNKWIICWSECGSNFSELSSRCETCRVWVSPCYKQRQKKKKRTSFTSSKPAEQLVVQTVVLTSHWLFAKHSCTHLKNIQDRLNNDMIFTPGKNNHHKRKSQQRKKKTQPKNPNKTKQIKTK